MRALVRVSLFLAIATALFLSYFLHENAHAERTDIKPAVVPTCTTAPPGMISWWDAEGSARDIRGENNATFNGTYAAGKVTQAFNLNGSDQYVSAPDAPSLRPTSLTLDGWFNFTSVSGTRVLIAKTAGTGTSESYFIAYLSGSIAGAVGGPGGLGPILFSNFTPTPGTWYHIAYTFDDATDTQAIYINGVQVATGTTTATPTYDSHPVTIGAEYENESLQFFFPGLIDEAEIFNRALSQTEISNIFNADSAGKCKPRCASAPINLVSWWDGDDDAGDRQGTNHGSMPPSGAGFGTGKVGRAFTFDGSQNPVTVPDNFSLDVQTFTIDAWVFQTARDGAEDIIVNKEVVLSGSNSTTQYEMAIKGTFNPFPNSIPAGNLVVFVGGISGLPNDDQGWVDSFGQVPLNTWTHVAMSYGSGTLSIYVNGVLTRQVTGLTGTVTTTNGPFRIGARNPNTGYPGDAFNGSIDEVEFFDRALSSPEIQALNNAGFAGKCKQCTPVPGNLTLWYPGDAHAREIVNNGNMGTLESGVGYAIGKVGQAFSFSGTGGVSIPDALASHFTNQFMLSAWVNATDLTNSPLILSKFGGGQNAYELELLSDGSVRSNISGDGTSLDSLISSTGLVTTGKWYHVATTFNGGDWRIYLNGVQVASKVSAITSIFPSTATLYIGRDNTTTHFFNGRIDEAQLTNRAFTQTEIQSIVAAGASGMCKGNATGGGAVQVQAGDATVIFNNTASNGRIDYQTLDTYQPGPMPFGYNSPLEVADVSTTVTFTGTTRVCFNLQASQFDVPFTQLRILHLEGNDLVNRTSLSQPSTRTLCADVTSFSPFVIAQNTIAPTSASLTLSGRVVDAGGAPLPGVIVELSGAKQGRTITDADGRFRFAGLTAGEFYSVTPELANFSFSPQARSLSLTGNFAEATFTASANPLVIANPVDTDMYFVRQQYLDFLGREPDEGGLQYWTSRISECGADADCIRQRRIDVSAAYFMSDEFQETGSFVYRLYKASYGAMPTYQQFTADRSRVAGGDSLEARKAAFLDEWVARASFKQAYPDTLTPENFVVRVMSYMGYPPRTGDWESYVLMLKSGSTRAQVLGRIIEDIGFRQREYNRAFVLMQYFGYLRRDADEGGFNFWLDVLENRVPGNYRSMVCAFLTSSEYQRRFSSVVTRSNSECAQ